MTSIIQPPPAYTRLHHHPLASAFMAILWATLLVVGVKGYCAMSGESVLAGEGDGIELIEPVGADELGAY